MIELLHIDCMEYMATCKDKQFDLMLTDPPYNMTACEWDKVIDLTALWKEWLRIVKLNGTFIFTSSQPFTTDLINSNRKNFKYEIIWDKVIGNNPYIINFQPMRVHENICIFYKINSVYNPIKTKRKLIDQRPNSTGGKSKNKKYDNSVYGKRSAGYAKNYDNTIVNPKSIIRFMKHPNSIGLHPTQKPVDLFRYLIKTYSNEGDTVFDGYMGSGTTAIACYEENRNFVGCEIDKDYYDAAVKRFENYKLQGKMQFA